MPQLDSFDGLGFSLEWDGKIVHGVSRISPLRRTTEVVLHRNGIGPAIEQHTPGVTTYDPITIERVRTSDPAFEEWANELIGIDNGIPVPGSVAGFRKDIILSLYNEAGQKIMAFFIYRCWPSAYEPLSALDADDSAVIMERLTLQNDGWSRDPTVLPPAA